MLICRLTYETSLQKGYVSPGFSSLTYFFNNTLSQLKSTSFILPLFMIFSAVFGGDHMVRVSICCTAVNTDQPGSAHAAGGLWFKRPVQKPSQWCVEVMSALWTGMFLTDWHFFWEAGEQNALNQHCMPGQGWATCDEGNKHSCTHVVLDMPLPLKQYQSKSVSLNCRERRIKRGVISLENKEEISFKFTEQKIKLNCQMNPQMHVPTSLTQFKG